MVNFCRFALIFVLIHSISQCDAQKSNAQCGLDGKTVTMTLDSGPAAVSFLTGKGETCIALIKSQLSFEDAVRSCNNLFFGGKMMSYENYDEFQSKIKTTSFLDITNAFYMTKDSACWVVLNSPGGISAIACGPTTAQAGYLCEYPMQYNCAWQFEYAEISSQSYTANVTIYAYANELGNKTGCDVKGPKSFNWNCINMFVDQKDWSQCSETCTDVNKPPPTQNMTRQMNSQCSSQLSSAPVLLHSVRTCNGHVPCNASSTDTTTATASSLRLVGIIIGAVAGSVVFAVVVAFGIWFFCCRRKRGNVEVTEKSTSKRSKVSQRSRNSTSMQQPSRSQSPGKRKTRKTKEIAAGDVVGPAPITPLDGLSKEKIAKMGDSTYLRNLPPSQTTAARAQAISLPPLVGPRQRN